MNQPNCNYRPYCLMVLLALLGILAFLLSTQLPATIAAIIRGLGSLLIGAALVDGLLTVRFQLNIEKQVTHLEESIEKQVKVLDSSINTLQNTVAIASGAVESGLTAVYSERTDCLETIGEKLTQLIQNARNAADSALPVQVKMLGISLGDFLCPHGLLQPIFRDLLKIPKCTVEIVILKDGSRSAHRRALREETGKFSDADVIAFGRQPEQPSESFATSYKRTKCHDELKTATDYLHDLLKRKTIDRDRPNKDDRVNATMHVYEYDYDPMTFLFMVDDDMFVENYHLAGRGGEAPILRVAKLKRQSATDTSRLYEIYSGHFEAIKHLAEEILE